MGKEEEGKGQDSPIKPKNIPEPFSPSGKVEIYEPGSDGKTNRTPTTPSLSVMFPLESKQLAI